MQTSRIRIELKLMDPEPNCFRPPTRREHWIAAGLFGGFGAFFVVFFLFLHGWWFRWVILALGIFSLWKAIEHVNDQRQGKSQ